jgi:hypothetical protein
MMSVFNSLLIKLSIAAWLMIAVGSPVLSHARATLTILILDGANEGFNASDLPDPASTAGGNAGATLGDQRRIAFLFAADKWANILFSDVPIRVEVKFDPLACAATTASLGAAGTNTVHRDFIRAQVSNTWYPAALANAIAGVDLSPGTSDINATFNSTLDDGSCLFPKIWYYGLDGNPPPNAIDFVSIVLHELGHGLGFQTFVNLSTGEKLGGIDDIFMLWLENHTTGLLYPGMTNAERVTASIDTGNLHWVGPNGIADSAGLTSGRHPSGHVEMYAPNPLEPGSSVSHFSTSLTPDELMEPSFTGANHDVGLARAVMADIGWRTAIALQTAPSVAPATDGGGGGGGCFISSTAGGTSALLSPASGATTIGSSAPDATIGRGSF